MSQIWFQILQRQPLKITFHFEGSIKGMWPFFPLKTKNQTDWSFVAQSIPRFFAKTFTFKDRLNGLQYKGTNKSSGLTWDRCCYTTQIFIDNFYFILHVILRLIYITYRNGPRWPILDRLWTLPGFQTDFFTFKIQMTGLITQLTKP